MEYSEATIFPGLISIILIDLDNFKKANKDEGHEYGNHILKDFASRLEGSFTSSAFLGRLEGDEFMIILDNQRDVDSIKRSAAQINQMAREITVGGKNAGLSASIGVAVAPQDGKTYNHLFHAADLALYKAKEQGRDCYHLASDAED
jgi:diguanylate cyclase (GGDEF)-like protein